MKVLTYEYEMMVRAGQLLNSLAFCGVAQARIVSELGNILDSGKPGEIFEKGGKGDDLGGEAVRENKLGKSSIDSDATGEEKPQPNGRISKRG